MIQNKHLFFSFFIVSLTVSAHSFDITVFLQSVKKNTQNFGSSLKESLHSNRARDFALLDYYNGESIKLEDERTENPIPAKLVSPVEVEKPAQQVEQPKITFLPNKPKTIAEHKETQNSVKMTNLQKKEKQQEATWSDYATRTNLGIGGAVVVGLCAFGWYLANK
jgi:hypothetical protein